MDQIRTKILKIIDDKIEWNSKMLKMHLHILFVGRADMLEDLKREIEEAFDGPNPNEDS